MTELSGAGLAKLANVSRQAVSKAKLPQTESGQYDLDNQEVYDWVKGKSRKSRKQREQPEQTSEPGTDLEDEKLQWDIKYLQARTVERELKNAQSRSELIPYEAVMEYAGAFSAGVRTYMLPIGNRLAPRVVASVKAGQETKDIQAMIEGEVSQAIARALEMGEAAVNELKVQAGDTDEDVEEDATNPE